MVDTVGDGNGPIERKVQVTGGSTYTVSIPKAWANARDIGSGSSVHLYPFDDRLVVARPTGHTSLRNATIDVDAVGTEALPRQIEAAYAGGSDEIRIESDTGFDSEQRRIASGVITRLIGVEIETETDHEILVKGLLDPTEISLAGTIDQLRQISLSMHENAVRAITNHESNEFVEHVIERDDDVDRLFALVSRQFYRALTDVREIDKLGIGRRVAFTQFRIARQLERIADHAELIADLSRRQSGPPGSELCEQFEDTGADARRVVRTALDGNTGEALLRRDDVVERLTDLDRTLYETNGENVYLYGRVLESIRRTAEYGGNVAGVITLREIATTA